MSAALDLKGIIPAAVLPMTAEGEIDEPELRKYVRWLAGQGVKAVAVSLGGEPWGHSVTALLSALAPALWDAPAPGGEMLDRGRRLDKHYVQPRYPNGFDSGVPGEYYTAGEADLAIADAEAILAFCRDRVR